MTARKKKGLATIISGVIFVAVGAIIYSTTQTPVVVGTILTIIGGIANVLGFAIVFPDTD
jgi:hypothetical protein